MKKNLFIISTIIIIISSINFVSYADCNMDIDYEKFIDFSKVVEGKQKIISQTIDGKEVKIIMYEWISDIVSLLNSKIKGKEDERTIIENKKIDFGALYHFLEIARSLIANTSKTESPALNKSVSKVSLNNLKRLAEKEESNSTTQGKLQGAIATLSAYGAGFVGFLNSLVKISKEGFKGFKDPFTLTYICVFTSLAGIAYNYYQTLQSSNVSRLITVYKNIKKLVYEGITKHKWIGKNVLITAVPTDSSCFEGYVGFHNIDGVHYNKSQDAINWEFAQAECIFLNADHDDCYQEAKKTIDCLWNNIDNPSKCKNNPYYRPYLEDD